MPSACTEWIKLISTQSNMVCEASSKKTISPEHVVEALKVGYCVSGTILLYCTDLVSQQLGFEDFVAEVEESNKDFKQAQKVCLRSAVPCALYDWTCN